MINQKLTNLILLITLIITSCSNDKDNDQSMLLNCKPPVTYPMTISTGILPVYNWEGSPVQTLMVRVDD